MDIIIQFHPLYSLSFTSFFGHNFLTFFRGMGWKNIFCRIVRSFPSFFFSSRLRHLLAGRQGPGSCLQQSSRQGGLQGGRQAGHQAGHQAGRQAGHQAGLQAGHPAGLQGPQATLARFPPKKGKAEEQLHQWQETCEAQNVAGLLIAYCPPSQDWRWISMWDIFNTWTCLVFCVCLLTIKRWSIPCTCRAGLYGGCWLWWGGTLLLWVQCVEYQGSPASVYLFCADHQRRMKFHKVLHSGSGSVGQVRASAHQAPELVLQAGRPPTESRF